MRFKGLKQDKWQAEFLHMFKSAVDLASADWKMHEEKAKDGGDTEENYKMTQNYIKLLVEIDAEMPQKFKQMIDDCECC